MAKGSLLILWEVHYTVPQYNMGGDNRTADGTQYVAYRKQGQIKYPAEQCVFIDVSSGYNMNHADVWGNWSGHIRLEQLYMFSSSSAHVDFRHNKGSNVGLWGGVANAAFPDGHAEMKKYGDISPFQWRTDKFWGWPP